MRRGLGYIHDPVDIDDLRYGFAAPARIDFATQVDKHDLLHPILDQGKLGSCVAHTVVQVIYVAHRLLGITNPKILSRLALYWLCRAAATPGRDVELTKWDIGTHIRVAFQILNRFGFCPEEAFPYSDSKVGELDGKAPYQTQPPVMSFMRSFDQKSPTRYRRIFGTGSDRIQAVKAFLATQGVLAFGTEVSEDFVDNKLPLHGPVGPPTGPIAGGHAMTLCGYDGDGFLVANSWGTDWGGVGPRMGAPPGYFWMDVDWLASDVVRDIWGAEHTAPYSEDA